MSNKNLPVSAESRVPSIFERFFDTHDNRRYDAFEVLFDNVLTDFDRIWGTMAQSPIKQSNYPPYNVRKFQDNSYAIELAVAGFAPEELNVTVENGVITVTGEKQEKVEDVGFIYRGVSSRAFTQRFAFKVGSDVKAHCANGLLTISIFEPQPPPSASQKISITT
jgi:molecular chaperone IbpA